MLKAGGTGGLAACGLLVLLGPARPAAAPCVRPARAGYQVQGDVRICPGRYRIPDPQEQGVIVISASLTRLDLTGVTLESGDTVASRFRGIGILSRGVERIEIRGGTIRGYRYGVRIEGGRGHRISGMDLSGSRRQDLRSTATTFNEADWLDIFHPDTFETYGAGLYLKWTDGASVTGVTARQGQNGIALFGARGSYLAANDLSENSGWGLSLWQSSHNTIVNNQASHNMRCESPAYSRGCDSAGLLLREHSDSNLIADNDLTFSGDGFFLSGERGMVQPSVGNLVFRNDASHAYHNAFESTFSPWNQFLNNRADSSAYGFWLGYSTANLVRGNTVVGSRETGIAIEHGRSNDLAGNTIMGGRQGIHLFIRGSDTLEPSRDYRVDDNVIVDAERGIVLDRTTAVRLRGNLLDRDGVGLVADSAASGTLVVGNIFARPGQAYVRAPELNAGGNYWDAPSPEATRSLLEGRITITPWQPASAAGY